MSVPGFNNLDSSSSVSIGSLLVDRINAGVRGGLQASWVSIEDLKGVDFNALTPQGKEYYSRLMFTKLNEYTRQHLNGQETLRDKEDVLQRFQDVPCPRRTALQVDVKGSKQPYLHANSVLLTREGVPHEIQQQMPGPSITGHILTQTPFHETNEMFWRAALESSNIIIDLTQPSDGVDPYFPTEVHDGTAKGICQFGDMIVTCEQNDEMHFGITVHQYCVMDECSEKQKDITRIHCPGWKDRKGMPDIHLLQFLAALEEHIAKQYPEQRPSFVHCRAGVGRAGTFAVITALREMHKRRLLGNGNHLDVINALILQGRNQRGPLFVQTPEQWQTLLEYSQNLIDKGVQDFFIRHEVLVSEPGKREKIRVLLPATPDEKPEHEVETALSFIHELVERKVMAGDFPMLTGALIDSIKRLLTGDISECQKETLYEDLSAIKRNGAAESEWRSTYYTERSEEVMGAAIPIALKNTINFALNLITPPVPDEVKRHPDFNETCYALGSQDITLEDLQEQKLKNAAFRKVDLLLRAGVALYPGKWVYLLRTSTTLEGPPGIHPFTISYFYDDKLYHARMAYNSNTEKWQYPMVVEAKYDLSSEKVLCKKGHSKYESFCKLFPEEKMGRNANGDLLNSFSSLQTLIEFEAVDRLEVTDVQDIVGVGKDTKDQIEIRLENQAEGEKGVEINSLFLRAYSLTSRDVLSDFEGETHPMIIPCAVANRIHVIKAMIQAVQHGAEDAITVDNVNELIPLANWLGMSRLLQQANLFHLTHHPHYFSSISSLDAEHMLNEAEDGVYLLRPSSSLKEAFAVSCKENGMVVHDRIFVLEEGVSLESTRKVYATLDMLLEDNSKVFVTPFSAL